MSQRKNLIGEKFNSLLVIEDTGFKSSRSTIWLCQCDCGKKSRVAGTKLKNGRTKSCGCHKNKNLNHKKNSNSNNWKGYKKITGSLWCRIRMNAEKRRKEFSIKIEEAWELFEKQNGKCAISGIELYFAKDSRELTEGKNTASLDRIDSKLGYTLENLQWVHVVVNYMKQAYDQDTFINWCHKISDYQKVSKTDK